jgi:adenine-specific DNA-methyltransferase
MTEYSGSRKDLRESTDLAGPSASPEPPYLKFMGSKRRMLRDGLGDVLRRELQAADRFVDLFCGSGAVSWYVAENFPVTVLSNDLQSFSTALSLSITGRTDGFDSDPLLAKWEARASQVREKTPESRSLESFQFDDWARAPKRTVLRAQSLCSRSTRKGIVKAYGGYYFSPGQALRLDSYCASLPRSSPEREICLAGLIIAAGRCAAAPGHTAQPLRPTRRGAKYLFEAWSRNVDLELEGVLRAIAPHCARVRGTATVSDATSVAKSLGPNDLAFVDPPYSSVHYSRFYHLLESVARQSFAEPVGAGRYPPLDQRPRSPFSVPTEARAAVHGLLGVLADRRVRTIVTFPAGSASNGLSGKVIRRMAEGLFEQRRVNRWTSFSTLGGDGTRRRSRLRRAEMILTLTPKGPLSPERSCV